MNTDSYPFRIGIAGCGAMGLPMAETLLSRNLDIVGFDIRPIDDRSPMAGHMATSAEEFASTLDIAFTVVRDIPETEALLFDQQSIAAILPSGCLLVVCSTLSPRYLKSLRDRLCLSIQLVDAPMSGAPHAARVASLTFMLGAREGEYPGLEPILEVMGKKIHYLGEYGAGMSCKVLNNYVAAMSVAAVRRSLAAARFLGVDPAQLRQVMSDSSGSTWFGNQFDLIDWSRQNYQTNNTIGLLEKDTRSFLDAIGGQDNLSASSFDDAFLRYLRKLPMSPD